MKVQFPQKNILIAHRKVMNCKASKNMSQISRKCLKYSCEPLYERNKYKIFKIIKVYSITITFRFILFSIMFGKSGTLV